MIRTKMSLIVKIVGLVFYFLLMFFLSKAQVSSDFSSNADGWTVFNGSTGASGPPTYNSTGGNPSGNISYSISTVSTNLYWVAPSKFNGNLSRAYNQTLTFDMLQSVAGADNSQNDVEIISGTTTLVYQLPAKPGTTWTSYSISLNETLWHNGCATCSAPSQIQMKQVLANVGNLEIRLKYSAISTGYIAQLDNVVLNMIALGTPPTVSSFTPTSALAGATVTISGTNFNTTAVQNQVYFKGVKATVTNATATQLTVTVPKSAAFGPITVVNLATNLQATSVQSFNPLFDNNKDFGSRIIPASMAPGYNTIVPMSSSASNGFGAMDKGDLDGDGWIDLVTTETSTTKIYAFRNLGTGGTVSAASFGPAITLPNFASIPGGSPALSQIAIVDIDSDGKLDVVALCNSYYTGLFAIFTNTSSLGNISFSAPQYFAYNNVPTAGYMSVGDLDGDGRIDLVSTTGTSPGNVWICQNQSTPGNIDFAFGVTISGASTSGYSQVVIGDLTGDGKPEIVCPGYNATNLSIYQNNSTPGTISMGAVFAVPSVVSYTNQLAMTDFDADNKLDMAWSTYGAQYVYLTKNLYSGGAFSPASFGSTIQITNTLSDPLGIAVGDMNADGKPDVVLSGYTDLAILQNVGSAGNLSSSSFTPTTLFQGSATGGDIFGISPVVADLDGDNKPEAIFVTSGGSLPAGMTGIYIYHNESFQPQAITSLSANSAASGSTVTVNGNYLNTHGDTPQVLADGMVSTPSNVSNTSLQFTVPTGFDANRISTTLHGLSAFSPNQFYTQLNGGAGGIINSSTFGTSVDYLLSITTANDGLTIADFDKDGKPDIVVNDNGTGKIYANTLASPGSNLVTGSFTLSGNTLTSGSHMQAADLDGNGIIDVVADTYTFPGTGAAPISFGAFSYSYISGVKRIVVNHDFNLDGKAEVITSSSANQVVIYENFTTKGPFVYSGSFASFSTTPVTLGTSGIIVGLTAADFDGDGFDDIAYGVNSTTSSLNVLRNTGLKQTITTSQFAAPVTFTSGLNPQYITTADFDGDGKMDLALANTGSAFVSVYLNTSSVGNISFTRQDITSPLGANGIEVGDIDGDGKPEIITINNPSGVLGSFSVFKNKSTPGAISFSAVVTYSLPNVPFSLAIADVNLDNKADVILARNGTGAAKATLSVFQNLISFPTVAIAPQPTGVYSVCDGATPTISTGATGTTNIIYQWQYSPDGIVPFSDLTNTGGYSNVSTSSFTINSTGNFGAGIYRCKITGDYAAAVYTNNVSFTVNAIPTAPTAPGVNNCGPGSVVITASGGTNGQYLWYDTNGLISGQNNNTYTTPVISATTTYQVAISNGTCVSPKTAVTATINSLPAGPTTSNVSNCGNGSVMLTAQGGTNGNYVWYDQNAAVITGQSNATYTTPVLSASTIYSVAITNGICSSASVPISITINTLPSAPSTQGASGCASTPITLTASGGSNGQYVWYMVATGGTAIAGEVNSTYQTPSLTTTTTYYVSITNGTCESTRTLVTATISSSGCSGPVIDTTPLATQIGGVITLNLVPLISTPGSTLNLTSLQVVLPPSSGATATIDANGVLTITYTGLAFSGTDKITIKACDINNNCTQQVFSVDVTGNITVYNGISPNGVNPKFIIQDIDVLPETKNNTVYIFDRWENLVWHGSNYDNNSVVFTGNSDSGSALPSGVYFYKIDFASGRKTQTGFISLRRL